MAEAAHALSILSKEVSIADEILDALGRCKSGTALNAEARGVIKQALALLQGEEVKLAKAHETYPSFTIRTYLRHRHPHFPTSSPSALSYVYEVTAHQRLHLTVEGLRRQVKAEERRIQDCARRLTDADAVLRGPLQDAKRLLEIGRQAEAAEIDVREVVDYAQRISGITSAPSYWKPGMAMVGFAPPAPRPEMMRAGALSAFSDAVGNSAPSDELMKFVQDLDRPPQKNPEDNGRALIDNGADNDDRSTSKGREGREEKRSKGGTMRTAGNDEGNGSDKSGVGASSSNFGRQDKPKRPKILLDLDHLDSDSDDDEEDDDDD